MKTLVHTATVLALAASTIGNAGAMTLRTHLAAPAATGWNATASQGLKLVNATDFGRLSSSTPMHIVVGLNGNRAEADWLAKQIYTPGSSSFHHFLTPAQFTALVSPSQATAAAVASYLANSGFTNVSISSNRLIVSANGNAGTAEKAFNTQLHSLRQFGKSIYANVTPAMVPASLGNSVLSVLGLTNIPMQTLHVKSPQSLVKKALKRIANGHLRRDVSPCFNPGPVCALNTYYPTDLDAAYDDKNTVTGTQTDIAIFSEGDLTAPIADLYQAWKTDGHAMDPITVVNVLGPATDKAGDDEWDIDSQSSTATAGNVKSLTFYNGTSLASTSITATFNQFAVDDRIPLGNASFGGCEALSYATGEMQTDDLILAETALQGQTVFASSGDGGSQCSIAVNPGAPVGGPVQTEYPGSSPYVTSVGGTSLLTNSADGSYYGEIAWLNGGGGVSYFENASPWQYNNIELAQTGKRLVPDIAMDADPNVSGMNTVVGGAYVGYGGTSLASPLAMGVYSRLMSRHGNGLGTAAASLYAAYNFATGGSLGLLPSTSVPGGLTQLEGAFNDVLTGSNTAFQATPGYDLTTGIGTLDINKLVILYGS